MDELLPPGNGEPVVPGASEERALAIYGRREEWVTRVTADEFLAANPSLARHVRAAREAPPNGAGEWLLRLALPLALLVLTACLLLFGDWKIAHLFSEPAAGANASRTLPVNPLDRNAIPPGSLAPIGAINEALEARPVNWETVLETAERLRASEEAMKPVRQSAVAYAWLYEVLTGSHMQLAENEQHRRRHYEAVVRLDREYGVEEARRPHALAYQACLALFEQAGGSRDLAIGQGTAIPGERLLDAIGRVANGYPAELAKSPEQQRQLLRIACYTRVRMIVPQHSWYSKAPFDPELPQNRENWTLLAEKMAQWEAMERDRPSGDLDRLRRVFWQAIDDFCSWPTPWKDRVTIGNIDYLQSKARAVLKEVTTRQTQRR